MLVSNGRPMKRVDDTFPALLDGFQLETLESCTESVYAVSSRFALIYFNPAYVYFAEDNDGVSSVERFPLGANLLDAIGGPARSFLSESAWQRSSSAASRGAPNIPARAAAITANITSASIR